MNDNTLIKAAAIVILAPIVVGTAISVINGGIAIVNGVSKTIAKSKLKKAIKEGRIVEIDGDYYEVESAIEEA